MTVKFFRAAPPVFFLALVFACKSTEPAPEIAAPKPETGIIKAVEIPEPEIPAATPAPEIFIPEPVPHELPLAEDDGGEGLLFPEDPLPDDAPEDDTDGEVAEIEEEPEIAVPELPPPVLPEQTAPEPEPQEAVVQPPEPLVPPAELPAEPPVQGQSPEPPEPPLAPEETPAPQRETPPPAPREPPPPPPFLRPSEPETAPPVREEVPMPVNPPPELPARPAPAFHEEPVVFSRIVRLMVGQVLEIPFRGTGWVYLGELGNRRGVPYISRRLDVEAGSAVGQTFVFAAEAAGTYILKFYKQDFIQDYIINDHVQVIVGERLEAPGTSDRVIAEPRWPPPGPPQTGTPPAQVTPDPPAPGDSPAAPRADIPEGEGGGLTPTTPPSTSTPPVVPGEAAPEAAADTPREQIASARPPETEPLPQSELPPSIESPAEYVRRARLEFDAGRVGEALAILDDMKRHYPLGTDEAWWLYGQLLEANSPARDIRLALEYYRRLEREYPQSARVEDAQRRVMYLERYYFNIR